jgi:hypothetical protein
MRRRPDCNEQVHPARSSCLPRNSSSLPCHLCCVTGTPLAAPSFVSGAACAGGALCARPGLREPCVASLRLWQLCQPRGWVRGVVNKEGVGSWPRHTPRGRVPCLVAAPRLLPASRGPPESGWWVWVDGRILHQTDGVWQPRRCAVAGGVHSTKQTQCVGVVVAQHVLQPGKGSCACKGRHQHMSVGSPSGSPSSSHSRRGVPS